MIVHFQTTLPLLREANVVAQVLFIGSRSRSPVFPESIWKRGKLFPGVFFFIFSVLLLGKEGGSKANRAGQGKAGSL